MRIFNMECLKMCVVVGLALIVAPGRPANAAPPQVGAYVYQQHKRSPADPDVDFTSALSTNFGGFSPSATLPDFGYGSGLPSTAAGFGFDDVPSGLLHLSHPYASTTFGSGFDSIGYPFSESTLNQLQFKSTFGSSSSQSLPVDIKYKPKVNNVNLHQSHFYGFPATESVKPTAQKAVPPQQTGPNEQRVPAESFNSALGSLVPLQQLYPAGTIFVPQKQSYPASISVQLQQPYSATVFAPQQKSQAIAISAPIQQSYPAPASVQQQQSYPATESAQQQRQQQPYPASASTQQQQQYPIAESVPQRQSYSASLSIPQQQSYSSEISVPFLQSFSAIASAPQQQSYPASVSVQQQHSYPSLESVPQQQSNPASSSVFQQQSNLATSEDFRITSYQQPTASGTAGPPSTSNVGSVPDLALELRPPPYTAPASPIDYQQNANIQSPPASSYPPADSNKQNNNYPINDFVFSSAPAAETSGQTKVFSTSNGVPLSGNTNDFLAARSNTKPDQTHTNVYYTAPVSVTGGSNSAPSNAPNYYSVPSTSYSLTSNVNGGFAGSTSAPPAAPIPSIGTDHSVPAANPTSGQNPSYLDTNSNPSVTYTNSNSISANSYGDSNSIQSSSYTTPDTPIAVNPYSDYKLSTENFYGDSNSISLNSKRESSTVNSSYKPPLHIQYSNDVGNFKTIQ